MDSEAGQLPPPDSKKAEFPHQARSRAPICANTAGTGACRSRTSACAPSPRGCRWSTATGRPRCGNRSSTPGEMSMLNEALEQVYALLKVDGDFSVMRHLYVDRIDFCTFGNSTPFRIRIVNAYNDNQDYFYVKKADASRVLRARAGTPALARIASTSSPAGRRLARGAHPGAARGDLHPSLAHPAGPAADPRRQGAGQVQRAVLRSPLGRHAFLQFRLRRDSRTSRTPSCASAPWTSTSNPMMAGRTSTCRSSSTRTRRSAIVLHEALAPARRPTSTGARSRPCCTPAPNWLRSAWTCCSGKWTAIRSPRSPRCTNCGPRWASIFNARPMSAANRWAPWSGKISSRSACTWAGSRSPRRVPPLSRRTRTPLQSPYCFRFRRMGSRLQPGTLRVTRSQESNPCGPALS